MEDIFDNFGSFIYIIITIVAFAISALGKKRKRDKNKMPLSNESPAKPKGRPFLSNLEQLLKEEMGITNNDYIAQPIIEQAKEEVLDSVPEELLESKEEPPFSIEYEDTSEIFSHSIEDSDITKAEDELIIKDFNLRDAVIYSEIINRKEY